MPTNFKMKKQITIKERIKQEEDYLAFLKKRLESKNFKNNVTKEEFDKTKAKYDKAKLVLKILLQK
jgi:hypothetical protein